MKVPPKIQGSGTAGKPGESTARAPGGAATAPTAPKAEKITLTPDGIEKLLKAELSAGDATEAEPGEEVQPEPETASVETLAADENPKAEGTEEGNEQTAEETPEEGAEAELTEQEQPELPAELQTAIAAWEEQGGGELPPVLQALVGKRVGKLISAREAEKSRADAAEARAQQLEAEVTQLREAAPNGAAAAPGQGVLDEKTLLANKQAYKTFVRDATVYLEDAATPAERQRVEAYMQSNGLDASGLRRQVQDARDALDEIPEQLQQVRIQAARYREQEQAAEPMAKKFFPWLENKTSPEYQEAQKVLQTIPDLKQRTPLHKLVLGIYVLGLKEFNKLNAPAAPSGVATKPKVPVKAPPKTPAAGAAAPAVARGNGTAAAEAAARQRFEKAPTRESVAELIKIGLRS